MNKLEEIKHIISDIQLSETYARDEKIYDGGEHIALVFDDGELASTKAGSLLWQRNLHCLESGVYGKALDCAFFPCKMSGHGYIFCEHEKGKILAKLIRDYLESVLPLPVI